MPLEELIEFLLSSVLSAIICMLRPVLPVQERDKGDFFAMCGSGRRYPDSIHGSPQRLPPYQGLPFMGLLARGNWGRREHHRAPGS